MCYPIFHEQLVGELRRHLFRSRQPNILTYLCIRAKRNHVRSVGRETHLLARRLLEHRAQLVRDLLVLLPVLCRVDGVARLLRKKEMLVIVHSNMAQCMCVSYLLASELLGLVEGLVEVIFTAAVGHFLL
jgi:hypothetical protein